MRSNQVGIYQLALIYPNNSIFAAQERKKCFYFGPNGKKEFRPIVESKREDNLSFFCIYYIREYKS